MRINASRWGPLLAALALAACAGASADFVKQGASRDEVSADNAACRAEAEAVAGRQADITRDIRVGERNRLGDSTRLVQQTRDIDDEARYERIFAACMKARGYALKE